MALPALVAVLALCLSGLGLAMDQIRCLDAARAGARMLARGDDPSVALGRATAAAPRGAVLGQSRAADAVTVTVSAPVAGLAATLGLGRLSASATAALEDDQPAQDGSP